MLRELKLAIYKKPSEVDNERKFDYMGEKGCGKNQDMVIPFIRAIERGAGFQSLGRGDSKQKGGEGWPISHGGR